MPSPSFTELAMGSQLPTGPLLWKSPWQVWASPPVTRWFYRTSLSSLPPVPFCLRMRFRCWWMLTRRRTCINPDLAEAAITPRTKAIIAVHMGGHTADLDRLKPIASRKRLALIEDSSYAHASEWRGQRVGTFGVAGTFSFQSSKLMTAGEGGIIISNDDKFEVQARSVHDCGRMPGEWFYSHFIYGSNYRLSEWQGAI